MASLLRPGGSVFIIDCFLEDPKYADLFNSHWHTRIGTIDEYFAAAGESGLQTGSVVDVTDRTVHFWTTTLALIDAKSETAEGASASRYAASSKAHRLVRDGLSDGGLRYAMLSFSKSAERKRVRRLRFPRLRSHPDGCSHAVTPADPLLLTASWRRPRAAFRNSSPRLSERDSFSLALAPL